MVRYKKSVESNKSLLTCDTFNTHKHFSKAYIPLNTRYVLENQTYAINQEDIPCFPNASHFPKKYEDNILIINTQNFHIS